MTPVTRDVMKLVILLTGWIVFCLLAALGAFSWYITMTFVWGTIVGLEIERMG